MPLYFTIILWLFIAAAANGLLLSAILLRWHDTGNRVLGWLMLLLSVSLLNYVFNMYFWQLGWNPGPIVAWCCISLFGPLLLRYTAEEFHLPWNHQFAWLHFLPAAFFLVQILAFPLIGKNAILLKGTPMAMLTLTHLTLYCLAGWYLYLRHVQPERPPVASGWLRFRLHSLKFMLLFMTIFTVSLIMYMASLVYNEPEGLYYAVTLKLVMTLAIYFTVFQKLLLNNSLYQEKPPERKYKTSALREETQEYIVKRLQKIMDARQLFLQPELRLKDTADELGTSTTYLSQAVNEKLGMGFPDYVNALRINHAKRLLCTDEGAELTMQEILSRSGFSNKTTFNKAFRDITGMTPTEYRHQYHHTG
ncbi:helix-turn-helix domain-containing protein [Chitinophaga lutea]